MQEQKYAHSQGTDVNAMGVDKHLHLNQVHGQEEVQDQPDSPMSFGQSANKKEDHFLIHPLECPPVGFGTCEEDDGSLTAQEIDEHDMYVHVYYEATRKERL